VEMFVDLGRHSTKAVDRVKFTVIHVICWPRKSNAGRN